MTHFRCQKVQNYLHFFRSQKWSHRLSHYKRNGKRHDSILGSKLRCKFWPNILHPAAPDLGDFPQHKPPRPPLTWKHVTPLFDPKSLKLFGSRSGVTKLTKMGTRIFAKSGSIFDSTFCQLVDPTFGTTGCPSQRHRQATLLDGFHSRARRGVWFRRPAG